VSVFVVDVSVAVKWMLPELLSTEAVRLQSPSHQLHAPSFFDVELANVLWKKVRQGILSRAQADQFLDQSAGLPLTRHADASLVAAAFDIADRTGRTVYDSMYLALALRVRGQMVTADARLVNSLAGSPWAASVIRLQDVL
jgi:predicted nucleic acid-binding protein